MPKNIIHIMIQEKDRSSCLLVYVAFSVMIYEEFNHTLLETALEHRLCLWNGYKLTAKGPGNRI